MIDWIILAGGRGERLKPTFDGPKALLPFNTSTLIGYQINKLLQFGATRIIISLGYMGETVKEYIEEHYFGNNIICVTEDEPKGTGGAIKNVIDKVPDLSKFFFVVNCDDLSDLNWHDLITIEGDTIVLGNFRCPYGVVHTRGNSIISFQQKPIIKDLWVSIGHYKLYKDSLIPLLSDKCSLEDDIFPKMSLTAFKQRGWWYPVNDQKQLTEVEEFLSKKDIFRGTKD